MSARRLPLGLSFLLTGAAAALLVRVDGADPLVHLGFVLACGALYLLGGAVEALLGLEGPFVFHRIVLGQLALAAYFCGRSLLPAPGVGRVELGLLLALCGAVLWRKRAPAASPAPWLPLASVWAVWWASTLIFAGAWSGRLETPGSDTDLHAWFARLTALSGQVARTQLPWSDAPVRYPSGLGVLDGLWALLSFVHPVQVVDCQVALQSCLAAGLAVEAMFAVRGRVRAAPALLLLAAAHVLFALPLNPLMPLLEGTARLAHKALLILPFTFALRAGGRRRAACAVAVACAGFAFILNPARLAVEGPVLLATAVVLAAAGGERRLWRGLAVGAAAALLFIAPDPWVRAAIDGGAIGQATTSAAGVAPAGPPLSVGAAVRGGLARLAAEGVPGCVRSGQCRPELDSLSLLASPLLVALALLALWLPRRRDDGDDGSRRAAVAVLALSLATVAAIVLSGAVDALLAPRMGTFGLRLLRYYVSSGLLFATALFLLVQLAVGLALAGELLSRLRPEGDLLAVAALVLVFALGPSPDAPTLLPRAPRSSLGPIDSADVAFVREASAVVPPSELLLLPGVASLSSPWEGWDFAVASSRAVPLYGTVRFAFFLGEGDARFDAGAYQRRVCQSLDLGWLAARGVRWLLVTGSTRRMSCVHALEHALPRYFDEKLRRGDKALYRLRDAAVPLAREDPELDVPLPAPLPIPRGEGLRGEAWLRGPVGVNGFACDRGVAQPVTVELQLRAGGQVLRELHGAAVPLEEVRGACGGSAAHGFAFAPTTAPPGRYRARLLALDAAGQAPLVLADDFELRVDL